MGKTATKPCDCSHASQDKIYGSGQRLHNIGGGAKSNTTYKCTVCGRKK
jgi:hypothetical protein